VEIRRHLNENPRIVGIIVGVLMLAALVVALTSSRRPADAVAPQNPGTPKEYFSTDDGKSFFPEDARKLPPFDHQGKPAFRARVFKCGENGQPFVAFLERYADADRKRLEELLATDRPVPDEAVKLLARAEVKKPGRPGWVKMTPGTAQQFNAVRTPRCPDGSTSGIIRVSPQ
jgi:hypothetical protein